MTFDVKKPARIAYNGGEVVILVTDAPGKYPIIGYLKNDMPAFAYRWTKEGKHVTSEILNLENIPEKKENVKLSWLERCRHWAGFAGG